MYRHPLPLTNIECTEVTAAMPGASPESPRATILVVDDNEDNRVLVQELLEDEGYEVVLADSGAAALRAFADRQIDCGLLDVRMPGMSGFELCAQLRSLPGGDEVPILFLTASRNLDTFEEAQRLGAEGFLTKPIHAPELALRVQTAVKHRSWGAELRSQYELIRRQRDDLMRLQLQKERLMQFVVHDLKNPVNSMDLNAQVIGLDKQLSERGRRAVTAIRSEAHVLTRMILNLLDITRSDEGLLEARRSELDLEELGRELVEVHQARAAALEVRLESEIEGCRADVDPDLVRRLLENLIDNAIRHSSEGGTVRLTANARADGVELCVSDEGSGIAEAERDRVFERHVQLDGDATRYTRGLGLAFCKAAAEAHGGSIRVGDQSPGATFCVWLPRAS